MSSCYKCGRELPDTQVECEQGCDVAGLTRQSDESIRQFIDRMFRNRRHIDWDKVTTLEDVILIISTIFCDATLDPHSAAAAKLEKFLLPKREDQP
jgi:uncharacterized membrane protein YvbJ